MRKDTFILVMPAYNEEAYIEQTIDAWTPIVTGISGSEVLVINDGSKDRTAEILQRLASKHKFIKVFNKANEGHGKTIFLGYKKAIKEKHDWVFQTDGDGHFEPADFYKLWEKRSNSPFILGHRRQRKDPAVRIILSKLISLWILFLWGRSIKDPNIPFRLIRRGYLKNLLKYVPEGVFAPNIFLSILAARDGHNLYQIPVKHVPRKKSGDNTLRVLKGAIKGFFELILFDLLILITLY